MYNLRDFGHMLTDEVRREAYIEALRRTVRPGSVVLEIGTGPGVFAMVAARLGAAKVIAVEPNDIIGLARQLVARNGLADRVELIQGLSTALKASEQVDVVLSDLRGTLPCFGRHLATISDAQERFLRPDGVLIPAQDRLWGSVVSAPEPFAKLLAGWDDSAFDLELAAARQMALNSWTRVHLPASACLTEPLCWATLDYYQLRHQGCAGSLEWRIEQAALAHGLALWFETSLVKGVGYSSAPGSERLYGQGFFPFPEPVALSPGDQLRVDLQAVPGAGDYIWRWQTQLQSETGLRRKFDQSGFWSRPLSPQRLRKRTPEYQPRLSPDAQVLALVLQRMNGEHDLSDIAAAVGAAFPRRFASEEEILDQVRTYSELYG